MTLRKPDASKNSRFGVIQRVVDVFSYLDLYTSDLGALGPHSASLPRSQGNGVAQLRSESHEHSCEASRNCT